MARENKRNREQRRLAENLKQITALQIETTTETTTQQFHYGPLPTPEVLEGYERVLPGLASRITDLATSEAEHRRKLESQLLTGQIDDIETQREIEKRGQLFALVIALATIIGGFVVIALDHA